MKDVLDEIMDDDNDSSAVLPIITDSDESSSYKLQSKEDLPVLALRNMVMFPSVVLPVQLGRRKSFNVAQRASKTGEEIAVFTQINEKTEDPSKKDLYKVGVVGTVIKVLEMPNGTHTAILHGLKRVSLSALMKGDDLNTCNVKPYVEAQPDEDEQREFDAVVSSIKERAVEIAKHAVGGPMGKEAVFAIKSVTNNINIINYISTNFPFTVEEKISLLTEDRILDRGMKLLSLLNQKAQLLALKQSLQDKVHGQIDKQQKEYFLQQQIKTIRKELGEVDEEDDVARFTAAAEKMKWNKDAKESFLKEVKKLKKMTEQSYEYGVQVTYLDNVLDLPWGIYTKDNMSLKKAQEILDKDHYGMKDVKDRIIEHLSVLKLRGDLKSPIICLYGPPGVGKTSLGHSIADALGRKYVRVALGGLHDESEIRGHRRTYVGSMMGRILKALKDCKSSNPVFILDEIDKISHENGFHGSPEAALLEVLDPEQNKNFHDNYIDIDYDLSKVLFIATANDISTISKPLRDRMEFINISGYSEEEKMEIAKRHIMPKIMKDLGMDKVELTITDAGLRKVISGYTRESGVRGLEKELRKILRKVARKIAMEEEYQTEIDVDQVKEMLGNHEILRETYDGNEITGVVTGLAWTEVGGEILFIETSLSHSKQPTLSITGQVKDVMKESAQIACEYVKCHADEIGIDPTRFDETAIHIHVPDGSTPKDGPSAGITMATAVASAFTGRKVKANLAMTGEITLRGKVTAVGGIKEKVLAAKRAGIKELIMCEDNRRDVEEIDPSYIEGLKFNYVREVRDVLSMALI